MTNSDSQHRKNSVEFLLSEYVQINEETRRLRGEGLSRLNFFITLTSSILAGLILLSQINVASQRTILLVSLGTLVFLALVGSNTFLFTISREIHTDLNIRATARIRRFFIDQDPEISKYLTWQHHDEPTHWLTHNASNVRSSTQSVLSLLCALIVGLLAELIFRNRFWSVTLGLASFVIALITLVSYAKKRFESAKKAVQDNIRFPQTTQSE